MNVRQLLNQLTAAVDSDPRVGEFIISLGIESEGCCWAATDASVDDGVLTINSSMDESNGPNGELARFTMTARGGSYE